MNINNVLEMFTQNYLKFLSWLFPVSEQKNDVMPCSPHSYLNSIHLQKAITDFLAWNGIDKKGKQSGNKVYPTRIEILETRTAVRKCGFSDGKCIEKLIVSEFLEMKKEIPNLIPEKFIYLFTESYHNAKLVKFSTLEVQKSTQTIKQYFDTVKAFLIEIQAHLKVVDLRIRIECNHSETGNWYHCSQVEEFVTPFARIGLNCDKSAKFSINYFINPRLKEIIGESLGNTLEKRFEELTIGEMKDFIKIIPLNRRYDKYFKELQTISNYQVSVTEQNSI